jgi:hypothetical protein
MNNKLFDIVVHGCDVATKQFVDPSVGFVLNFQLVSDARIRFLFFLDNLDDLHASLFDDPVNCQRIARLATWPDQSLADHSRPGITQLAIDFIVSGIPKGRVSARPLLHSTDPSLWTVGAILSIAATF